MDRLNDGSLAKIRGTDKGNFSHAASDSDQESGCYGKKSESGGPLGANRQDWSRRHINRLTTGGILEQLMQGLRDQLLEAEDDAKRASRKIRRLQSQLQSLEQLQALQQDLEK